MHPSLSINQKSYSSFSATTVLQEN